MSASALIERFDLIVDHQEHIQLLRRYVVDLALRGKLLDEGSWDMSAPQMLERIETSRRLFAKTAKKRAKSLPPVDTSEIPAQYADKCTFEALGNIANIQKGLTGIRSSLPGEFPLVVTAAERSTCDHFDFDCAAAIIPLVSSTGHGNASLNRLHYQEGKFALGTILCAVVPIAEELISARFLFEYLTAFKDELLVSQMKGTANVTLTVTKIANVPVPIIAPSVQKSVDSLMKHCDQLEVAQKNRDTRRQRFVDASMHLLEDPDARAPARDDGTAQWSAKDVLKNISQLTTRPEHLEKLRQAIASLAVRGLLVAQDTGDEVVEIALRKNDEAREATARKDRRATGDSQDLLEADSRWEVPTSWAWRGLADLALFIDYRGKTPTKVDSGIRLITAKNVRSGFINTAPEEFLTEDEYESWMTRGFPASDDVLFTTEAPLGNAAVVRISERFGLAQRVICFRLYGAITPDFLVLQLLSHPFRAILEMAATGLTAKGIKAAKLKRLPIAVPPLAEQYRIVSRFDELMDLCDLLGDQLKTSTSRGRRLLEATIHSAL